MSKHVDHGYAECYDTCPYCDADVSSFVEDSDNVVDCFNMHQEFNGWESITVCDLVYECPHCGKRFYIEESY